MKIVRILNVPDEIHSWLKIQAVKSRMTMNNYILELLKKNMENERTTREVEECIKK